jgi:hypothetical protein
MDENLLRTMKNMNNYWKEILARENNYEALKVESELLQYRMEGQLIRVLNYFVENENAVEKANEKNEALQEEIRILRERYEGTKWK